MKLTDAQAELVASYQGLISLVAYSFTRDPGLVADLVSHGHESLCCAARSFDPARGVAFRAFANVVLKRDMVDFLRSRQHRLEREEDLLAVDCWASGGDELVSLESLDLERALSELPELLRVIVVESVFEGRSMREIGTRRGKSHVWVWMRYHEALEKLREVAIVRNWYGVPSGRETSRSDAGAETETTA